MNFDEDDDLFKVPPSKEPKKRRKKSTKKKTLEILAGEEETVDIFADDTDIFSVPSGPAFSRSSKEPKIRDDVNLDVKDSKTTRNVIQSKDGDLKDDLFGFDVKDDLFGVDQTKSDDVLDDDEDFFAAPTDQNVFGTQPVDFDFSLGHSDDDLFSDTKLATGTTFGDSVSSKVQNENESSGDKSLSFDLFGDATLTFNISLGAPLSDDENENPVSSLHKAENITFSL